MLLLLHKALAPRPSALCPWNISGNGFIYSAVSKNKISAIYHSSCSSLLTACSCELALEMQRNESVATCIRQWEAVRDEDECVWELLQETVYVN